MELTDLKTIKSILQKHNKWANKGMGQNFLINQNSLSAIVESANIKPSDHVIEIGPGLGVLTQELVKHAKKVTSLELDPTLFPILEETVPKEKYPNLEIIHQDALRFTPPSTPYKIVANIPYNITSPLISHFLHTENKAKSMTLLVQLEVAEKICLTEPKMTILSLQIALFGTATLVKKIASSDFYPQPKVDSAILHIEVDPKVSDEEAIKILKVAKRAFSQRRKKLSNTLPELKNSNQPIDLNRRPETLSIEEWRQILLHL